jgi:hypothetical protein
MTQTSGTQLDDKFTNTVPQKPSDPKVLGILGWFFVDEGQDNIDACHAQVNRLLSRMEHTFNRYADKIGEDREIEYISIWREEYWTKPEKEGDLSVRKDRIYVKVRSPHVDTRGVRAFRYENRDEWLEYIEELVEV